MDSKATQVRLFKVCVSAHVALRMPLPFSQQVKCIFWPILKDPNTELAGRNNQNAISDLTVEKQKKSKTKSVTFT